MENNLPLSAPGDGSVVPVIAVARAMKNEDDTMLSTGIRAKIKPVSATLIDAVTSRVKDPAVPTVYIQEKDREMPNPDDPQYQSELTEAGRKRGLAALDAIIMFGVELLEPVPPLYATGPDGKQKPTGWFAKLKFMEKQGLIDLSEYDMDDADTVEFVFKRFVAVSPSDIDRLNRMNRVSAEDVNRAESSFRR